MHSIVVSEDGYIGYAVHGSNKQSKRRSKTKSVPCQLPVVLEDEEQEVQQVASAI